MLALDSELSEFEAEVWREYGVTLDCFLNGYDVFDEPMPSHEIASLAFVLDQEYSGALPIAAALSQSATISPGAAYEMWGLEDLR